MQTSSPKRRLNPNRATGSRVAQAVLNEAIVTELRRLRAGGATWGDLAKYLAAKHQIPMRKSTISKALNHQWQHALITEAR